MVAENIATLSSNADICSIVEEKVRSGQEDAFFVCDLGDVVNKYKNWKQQMPRVHPYYAVKCNDSSPVLQLLSSLGANFDCASKGEISKLLSLGVSSDRIIYAHPAKQPNHIRFACESGVTFMTFDNEAELYKVKKSDPNNKAKMIIRIRRDGRNDEYKMGNKFGCDPKSEAPYLLKVAKALDIEVVGVSFHVGCGCDDPIAYREAIAASRDLFNFAESIGFKFNLVDIGGGFPGYRGTKIDELADIINKALDDYFPNNPDMQTQIIAEPGIYFVGSAFHLACNVHSVKTVKKSKETHNMYYVNDGLHSCFNEVVNGPYKFKPTPKVLTRNTADLKYYASTIWGQTCDASDIINENVLLPQLKCGDWLVFEDMGGYTLAIASGFNGFSMPKVHYVVEEKYKDFIVAMEELQKIIFPNISKVAKECFVF